MKGVFLVIIVLCIFGVTGCSTLNKAIKVPPEKAKTNTDALCAALWTSDKPDNSIFDYYVGVYTGFYKDDWKQRLNIQQKMDLDDFKKFCAKKPEDRTALEYGYWTGTKFRTLYDLIPDEILLAVGVIK
jgi:hypothetical protein